MKHYRLLIIVLVLLSILILSSCNSDAAQKAETISTEITSILETTEATDVVGTIEATETEDIESAVTPEEDEADTENLDPPTFKDDCDGCFLASFEDPDDNPCFIYYCWDAAGYIWVWNPQNQQWLWNDDHSVISENTPNPERYPHSNYGTPRYDGEPFEYWENITSLLEGNMTIS